MGAPLEKEKVKRKSEKYGFAHAFYCRIGLAMQSVSFSCFRDARVTLWAHSGQTQKSNATSGFRHLELRKTLKRKPARLL